MEKETAQKVIDEFFEYLDNLTEKQYDENSLTEHSKEWIRIFKTRKMSSKKLGIRFTQLDAELEEKDILWKDPFGYVFKSSDDGQSAKMCTIKEVNKAVDEIVDERLNKRGYFFN